MQHMEELWMESHIDLYREDGDAAWDRMTRQWPNLQRSLLMRVQLIRIGMRHLRARCALAKAVAVGIGTGDAQALLDAAERDARRVERESMPWGNALAQLIHAAVAAGRGDRAGAAARLEAAVAQPRVERHAQPGRRGPPPARRADRAATRDGHSSTRAIPG